MDISSRITESQIGYHPETDSSSTTGSLNDIDTSVSCASQTITQRPVQVASAQSVSGTLHNSRNSLSVRPQSFPYQPNPTIDDRLRELTLKYEIQEELGERLRLLEEYEIIILCDDSGSMKTTVDGTNRTRWDELCDIAKIVLEIGVIFDSTGVDVYFLNRRGMTNVINPEAIDGLFAKPPRGYTPLVTALKYIFQLPATQRGNDKKALVFVATDGAPTDEKGNINVNELEHLMTQERQTDTTHVMFLICTDDPTCVDYLNEWDQKMTNVDVTDDYRTERDKIRKYRGPNYPFSIGDYIVKALIGAIDPQMDRTNEPGPAINPDSH